MPDFIEKSSASMKVSIFWDITPRSPLKINQRFGGICRFACCLLHAGLFGLFLDPEDGGEFLSETSAEFRRITLRYVPEKSTLHN
jgi:hypothetical protein